MPTPPATVKVPAATDWLAASKIVAIEIAFLASVAVGLHNALLGQPMGSDTVGVIISTGGTLGILRGLDIAANLINVKSYLNSPTAQSAGVVPQAAGTPLVTTTAPPVAPEVSATP